MPTAQKVNNFSCRVVADKVTQKKRIPHRAMEQILDLSSDLNCRTELNM